MSRDSGFTLAELMTVVAVIAIMSAIAVPGVMAWLPKYRLGAAARQVHSAIEFARMSAVKENASVAVFFNLGNGTYRIWVDNGQGGGVADDVTQNGAERILQGGEIRSDVAMSAALFSAAPGFHFNGMGLPFRSDGSPGGGFVVLTNTKGQTRTIVLNNGGNVRIQ